MIMPVQSLGNGVTDKSVQKVDKGEKEHSEQAF